MVNKNFYPLKNLSESLRNFSESLKNLSEYVKKTSDFGEHIVKIFKHF